MTICHILPRGTRRIPLIYKDSNHTALPSNTLFTSTEPWQDGKGGTCLAVHRWSSTRSDPWGDTGIQHPRRRSAPSVPGGSEVEDIPGWCAGRSRTKPESTFWMRGFRAKKEMSGCKHTQSCAAAAAAAAAARSWGSGGSGLAQRWSHNGDLGG